MPKPQGLGPRMVAVQQAKITKEEAGKQIAAQSAAGVPPERMVLTNPETGVTVKANATLGASRARFLGIDITGLVNEWNKLMDKLGLNGAKAVLGQTYKTNQWDGLGQSYKTNQWDGTISELERK